MTFEIIIITLSSACFLCYIFGSALALASTSSQLVWESKIMASASALALCTYGLLTSLGRRSEVGGCGRATLLGRGVFVCGDGPWAFDGVSASLVDVQVARRRWTLNHCVRGVIDSSWPTTVVLPCQRCWRPATWFCSMTLSNETLSLCYNSNRQVSSRCYVKPKGSKSASHGT